jgi:hypothetical protein
MTEQGVPREEATAKDFMQVRAALVRRLGGANEALVWTRIDWRADSARVAHQTADGTHWWAATYPEIAEETGLSAEQVRRAIDRLVEGGFLRAEQQHGFSRKRSYAPIYSHVADSPDGEDARSKRQDRQIDLADSTDVPLIETSETGDTPVVPTGDDVAEKLSTIWSIWPPSRRSTRKVVERSLRGALKSADWATIIDAAKIHARVWASWPAAEVQYVPLLSTWLNQERWTTVAPQPRGGRRLSTVDAGRAADAILAQHEHLAVTA